MLNGQYLKFYDIIHCAPSSKSQKIQSNQQRVKNVVEGGYSIIQLRNVNFGVVVWKTNIRRVFTKFPKRTLF